MPAILIFIYTNAKFIAISRPKPRTLNDVGEDSVQYRKRKKSTVSYNLIMLMASLSRLEGLFLDVASYTLNNCSF